MFFCVCACERSRPVFVRWHLSQRSATKGTNRLTVNGEKIDVQSDNEHSVSYSSASLAFRPLLLGVFYAPRTVEPRKRQITMEICMRAARLCSLTRVVTSCTSLIRTLYGPTAQRDTSDTLKREYTEQMTRWHIYFFTLCRCRSSHHYNTYRTTKPAPNSSRRVERHFTHISFIAAKKTAGTQSGQALHSAVNSLHTALICDRVHDS